MLFLEQEYRKYYLLIFVITLVVITIFVMNYEYSNPTEIRNQRIYDSFYTGIVTKKKIDSWEHDAPLVYLKNKTKVYIPYKFYENIVVGDSIIKEKSSYQLIIFRDKTKKVYSYLEE